MEAAFVVVIIIAVILIIWLFAQPSVPTERFNTYWRNDNNYLSDY